MASSEINRCLRKSCITSGDDWIERGSRAPAAWYFSRAKSTQKPGSVTLTFAALRLPCAARQRKSRVPVIGLAGARSGRCGCRYPPPATWPRREAQKNPDKGPGCLTRMLHEGGPFLTRIGRGNHDLCLCLHHMAAACFVLFGFRARRASHLDRSPTSHSNGYACSADRSTCFARHALNSEPFMQHAGSAAAGREFRDRRIVRASQRTRPTGGLGLGASGFGYFSRNKSTSPRGGETPHQNPFIAEGDTRLTQASIK